MIQDQEDFKSKWVPIIGGKGRVIWAGTLGPQGAYTFPQCSLKSAVISTRASWEKLPGIGTSRRGAASAWADARRTSLMREGFPSSSVPLTDCDY